MHPVYRWLYCSGRTCWVKFKFLVWSLIEFKMRRERFFFDALWIWYWKLIDFILFRRWRIWCLRGSWIIRYGHFLLVRGEGSWIWRVDLVAIMCLGLGGLEILPVIYLENPIWLFWLVTWDAALICPLLGSLQNLHHGLRLLTNTDRGWSISGFDQLLLPALLRYSISGTKAFQCITTQIVWRRQCSGAIILQLFRGRCISGHMLPRYGTSRTRARSRMERGSKERETVSIHAGKSFFEHFVDTNVSQFAFIERTTVDGNIANGRILDDSIDGRIDQRLSTVLLLLSTSAWSWHSGKD